MYLINVTINEASTNPQSAAHLAKHQAWFEHYFEKGDFLLIGPSQTYQHAGVILAQTDDQSQLDKIIAEDVYYPDLADYAVNEFTALKIAPNITEYQAK
ncbi:YciI family protein [Enterococcus pingfangensis]